MIQINLMPDVKQELLRAQRVRSAVVSVAIIVGIAAVGLVAVLAIYVYAVQAGRNVIVDNSIEAQAEELASVEDLSKTLTIQNQLVVMSNINERKRINSRLYEMLGVVVPGGDSQVGVSRLVLNNEANEQTLSIEAQSPRGYLAAEQFTKQLNAAVIRYNSSEGESQTVPLASNVVLSDTSYGEDQNGAMVLRFVITFTYASEVFSSQLNNVRVEIPRGSAGNVTDSYIGIPRSIFTTRAEDIVDEGEE